MYRGYNNSYGIGHRYNNCPTSKFTEFVDKYYKIVHTVHTIVKLVQLDVRKSFQATRNPQKPFIFFKHITLKNFLKNLREIHKNLTFLNKYLCSHHKILCGESQFAHKIWISSFKTYELHAYQLLINTPYAPYFLWGRYSDNNDPSNVGPFST